MKSKYRIALVIPPLNLSFVPLGAIASICNELNKNGFEAKIFDINIDFSVKLKEKNIKEKLKSLYLSVISKINSNNKDFFFLAENYKKFLYLIENYNKNVNVLKSKNLLKNAKNFLTSRIDIENLFIIINKLINYSIINCPELKIYLEELIQPFLKKLYKYNPDLIGISLQFQNSFLLSSFIKDKCKSIIFHGGPDINDILLNNQIEEIFSKYIYTDYLIYGYSEEPVVNLAKALSTKNVASFPNIINVQDNKCTSLDITKNASLKSFKKTKGNYNGIDFKKYFLPKAFTLLEIERGCYYNKCQFCVHSSGNIKYTAKNVDDVIEEIKEIIDLYGINHFTLGTSSLHPNFAKEFADKIIENNLKIYYGTFIRFDKRYTDSLLTKMYKSGLRYCAFGFETGSQRLLDLYDKGTDIKTIERIIKKTHELGICNVLHILLGLLNETQEDVDLSMDFITRNFEYIDAICKNQFNLQERLLMFANPERFGYTEKEFKKLNYHFFKTYYDLENLTKMFENKPFQYLNESSWLFSFEHSIYANSKQHP